MVDPLGESASWSNLLGESALANAADLGSALGYTRRLMSLGLPCLDSSVFRAMWALDVVRRKWGDAGEAGGEMELGKLQARFQERREAFAQYLQGGQHWTQPSDDHC